MLQLYPNAVFVNKLNALYRAFEDNELCLLIRDFPDRKDLIFQFIVDYPEVLKKYYHIKILLRLFPEHEEKVFGIINNPNEFLRIVDPLNCELFWIVEHACSDFPNQKNRIIDLLPPDLLQVRLRKFNVSYKNATNDLYQLCKLYPNEREKIYQYIKDRNIFRNVVGRAGVFCILTLTSTYLQSFKEKLLQILFDPTMFGHVVHHLSDLQHMAKCFPEYSEVFNKSTVKEAAREALKYSEIHNAYTKGATIGLFHCRLPWEIASHIGSYLERHTGGCVARVNHMAARTAKEETTRCAVLRSLP